MKPIIVSPNLVKTTSIFQFKNKRKKLLPNEQKQYKVQDKYLSSKKIDNFLLIANYNKM